jgi:thiol-disulfide isomerase/thioredoxin
MKNPTFEVYNILWVTWLVCLAFFLGPWTSPAKEAPSNAARKAAERLKENFDTIQQFEAAAKEAAEAGVPPQAIAEAKLVFCCGKRVTDRLPNLIKELESMLPAWKEADSPFFRNVGELEGVISFAKALLAEQANDESGFEKFIKEAFWRNPDLDSACSKKIKSHRAKQREANLVLPMNLELPLSNGGQTSLAELIKGHKAVLLDFWASWCGPCMSLMGELRTRGHELATCNIVVAAINTDALSEGGTLAKAKSKSETVRKSKKMDLPWLVEPTDEPLSRLLEIDSIPRAVLVSPEGKILYNGHPSDPGLVAALAKLGAQLAATTSP